jgi:hypothetical protein
VCSLAIFSSVDSTIGMHEQESGRDGVPGFGQDDRA